MADSRLTDHPPVVPESEASPRMTPDDMVKILSAIEEKRSDEMVRLTRRTTNYTIGTLVIFGIYTLATIFLWTWNDLSLKETQKSNQISEKALEETKRSNLISENALRESVKQNGMNSVGFNLRNRPYVAVHTVGVHRDAEKRRIVFQLRLKNFGNMVADQLERDYRIVINEDIYDISELEEGGERLKESNVALSPGVEHTTSMVISDHKNLYSKIIEEKSKVEILYDYTYGSSIEGFIGGLHYKIRYHYKEDPKDDWLEWGPPRVAG